MKKIVIGMSIILAAIILAVALVGMLKSKTTVSDNSIQTERRTNLKDNTYSIDGKSVVLTNGYNEEEVAPGSASKIVTRYFGNDVLADFNGDGVEDSAFLLTQERGGTGTFFYVVARVSSGDGFVGTNAILLGDRVAPQTTEYRNGMIIVNYADRAQGESFFAQPSVGVSKYFKVIDAELKEIVLVVGEAEARIIAETTCIKGGEALSEGIYNENSKTWWFDANLNATQEGCNPACVVNGETKTAEINWRCTGLIAPKGSAEEIQKLFADKYPKYAKTVAVSVDTETQNHARGAVMFKSGAPGGIFLAAKINGVWQLVFDGNGPIPCSLAKYGFPGEMLADCI